MNRLSIIIIVLLALCGSSCKSHKATVVRASGKPATSATAKPVKSKDNEAKSVPKNAATDKNFANDKRISGELVKQARTWIGTPYRYGAKEKKKGTDCSGFTMSVFKDVADVALPRNSAEQCEYCFNVPRNALQPGDLVFFTSSTRGGKVTHVGLYIGDGKMIHASTSRGVIESALDEKYYASHYHSSGRVYAITYAATGGKKSKGGDSQEIDLAAKGVTAKVEKTDKTNKTNKTDKTNKTNKSDRSNKTDRSNRSNKTDKSEKADKPYKEVTLDEFVASQAAPKDSVVAVNDSVASPVAAPSVVVNGKPVQATKVEPAPTKAKETQSADTVRAEAIKNEVVKAMKFGK